MWVAVVIWIASAPIGYKLAKLSIMRGLPANAWLYSDLAIWTLLSLLGGPFLVVSELIQIIFRSPFWKKPSKW